MPVNELIKYGLVFGSSAIGSIGGYFYSSQPINLRMKMEKRGQKLLRSIDPLWMYERIVTQKKDEILKELPEVVKYETEVETSAVEGAGSVASEESTSQKTKKQTSLTDQAFDLLKWCETILAKGNWTWDEEGKIVKFCEYPSW